MREREIAFQSIASNILLVVVVAAAAGLWSSI